MAKKRISSVDLIWLILQQMDDGGSQPARLSLAVVADEKLGWRAIVGMNSRRFLTAEVERRLADVQRRLRLVYHLHP